MNGLRRWIAGVIMAAAAILSLAAWVAVVLVGLWLW